jgi:hypothetical protein
MKFTDLNDRQKRTFVTMYRNAHRYSTAIIGERFGVSAATLAAWAKACGLPVRVGNHRPTIYSGGSAQIDQLINISKSRSAEP